MTCDICGDAGFIRLPIQRTLSVIEDDSATPCLEQSSRQYSCPECSTGLPVSGLQIISGSISIPEVHVDGNRHRITIQLARTVADKIARAGLMRLEEIPTESFMGKEITFQGSLGIVSPDHVGMMEERIKENDRDTASALAHACYGEINAWGSAYSGSEGNISKGQARDAVKRALGMVLGDINSGETR